MQLSVVLPCYNEQATIEHSVKEVHAWMSRANISGEIIVVDDGSKDNSPAILKELSESIQGMRVVTRATNGGAGASLRDGFDAAAGEWIAYMDSDGQFKADDLSLLYAQRELCDFVTGRRVRRADPLPRVAFGLLLELLNGIAFGLWVRDVNCGMKMFRKNILPDIRPTHDLEKMFSTEIFLRLKLKHIPWKQIDISHYPRNAGKPTGASLDVIMRMVREIRTLRRFMKDA